MPSSAQIGMYAARNDFLFLETITDQLHTDRQSFAVFFRTEL